MGVFDYEDFPLDKLHKLAGEVVERLDQKCGIQLSQIRAHPKTLIFQKRHEQLVNDRESIAPVPSDQPGVPFKAKNGAAGTGRQRFDFDRSGKRVGLEIRLT